MSRDLAFYHTVIREKRYFPTVIREIAYDLDVIDHNFCCVCIYRILSSIFAY